MSNDFDNSSTESKPSKTIKQSGFGLKQRLRSGYTKRFGSIISSKSNSGREDHSDESSVTPISAKEDIALDAENDKLSNLSSSSQLNMNNNNNTCFYILRRNNSRTNSRSNSIVNSLYLHNINTNLLNTSENNGGSVSTPVNAINTISGFTTPKMGPMTPSYPYNSHRYQNSISSFSSIDLDNNQVINSNNIDLTNEFINIFKQEYENHCINPKITPFDQSNPPPGVVEMVYQKSISVCKKNKVYVCKINKNSLNLDNNDKLFNILKHIIKESLSFNNRRNVSRANSVTSFQLDTSYQRSNSSMLNYVNSTIGNVSSKGLLNFDHNKEDEESFKDTTPEDETFLLDEKENVDQIHDNIHDTPIKNSTIETDVSSKKKNAFTNPILFSPRKLKRDSKHLEFEDEPVDEDIDILVSQIHKPQFLTTTLLEGNNINTNFKFSNEREDSQASGLECTDEIDSDERSNKIELKQAPFISKKSI